MKLSAAIASLAIAGSAVAAPEASPETFTIMSLRSASPIHFGQVGASKSNIFINSKIQDSVCEAKDMKKDRRQTFFHIKDGALYLYTPSKAKIQKAFVDRSGMGQGKLGYLSGDGPLPPRFEDKGWRVDKTGNLSFNGRGLLACPGSNRGAWVVWVDTGNPTPGGSKDCLGFSARTIPSDKPIPCKYSQ